MFKFLRKHPPKDSEERDRLKKELFGYRWCVDHGFPSKPSALAYDPILRLMAIGTKTGRVTIYGNLGVEFSGQHKGDVSVNQLFFLKEQARVVTLCSDNTLHLWEINTRDGQSQLEEVKTFTMESNKLKAITAWALSTDSMHLLLGTEGGNIHTLDIKSFSLMEPIIYQDVVMQNVPDDFKVNPGPVEAIAVHPTDPSKFLIGYNRGLIVLWDNTASNADQTYNSTQQLESLSWHRSGDQFMSAHSDGSYIVWSISDSTSPKEPALTPYGPFPCKAISKIDWTSSKVDPFIIFSGGMPRASYGDRHTISVMQGQNNHVAFDFTSKVVDFIVVTRAAESETTEERPEYDDAHTLIVLVDEELVVIDLDSANWPTFRMPYLNCLHSSAITCTQHISNVPEQLWQKIVDAGELQMKQYSQREWPINGGKNNLPDPVTKDLLLTGHEDGTVHFWDASTSAMKLLYKLSTAGAFKVDVHPAEQNAEVEEEWPPFRKVGIYDPYTDDPRLGIQKIGLCPLSETLVVAGTVGQVIILQMEREEREQEVKAVTVNIVSDRDGFVWKGQETLIPKDGDVKFAAGYQPTCIMQLYPPAACSALAYHSEWQMVAAGTSHGFALFDYQQKVEVYTRCTLNPSDMTGAGDDAPMSRGKSLKKSLRESFRRLRRRRSERRQREEKAKAQEKDEASPKGSPKTEGAPAEVAESPAAGATAAGESPSHKPVERSIEFRKEDDVLASMVRCLYFADTFIHGANHNPSLWVGTNGGHIFIYNLSTPSGDKRNEEACTCMLAKEIKLRHKAPVISIAVVDGRSRVLPDALEVQHERAKAPDMSAHNSVIICSEEQLKVFSLPHLKARWKFKITAVDGSRLRKVAFVNFRSRKDENYTECDIACISNQGDLSVYSVNNLKQQVVASALKQNDIIGISSFTFTKYGQGFFLTSASEFARVTLSARYFTEPQCEVELKEGMRPEPEPEAPPVVVIIEPEPGQTEEEAERTAGDGTEGAQPLGEATHTYSTGDITAALDDSQNESRADTTLEITQDSIREGEITQDSIRVVESSVHETSTISSTTESSTVHIEVTTVEEQTAPSSGGVESSNIDDDTKATQPGTPQQVLSDVTEKVTELKISEDGDDDPALLKQQQHSQVTTETVVSN